jgi:putative FmdB family regulatory protein
MPTYDYECTKCGDEFCVEQSMKDKPLRKCSKCGGKLIKLLPKSLNLIFKGSGFYVTDYGRGNGPAKARACGEDKKTGEAAEKAAGSGKGSS